MKFQPLNKYSNDEKGIVSQQGQIVYSMLNYCKVKITENSGTEWNEIAKETVWKIDKKVSKKSNS